MIIPKYVIDQNIIDTEIREIIIALNEQRQLKHILLLYLEKLSANINNIENPNNLNTLSTYIMKVEKSFETIKENINNLLELKNSLESLSQTKDNSSFDFKKYNQDYNDLKLKISSNNQLYFSIMESILNFMQLNIPEANITKKSETNFENKEIVAAEIIPDISEKNQNNEVLKERTLTISESDNIVILPYSQNELEEFFTNNPEKYSSMQDIIDKEYTYSLKTYKNNSSTRFKKIFHLAQKSNFSYLKSLNFARKLYTNPYLHPATISACKNTIELENYLECLSNNNLNNFKPFKIVHT